MTRPRHFRRASRRVPHHLDSLGRTEVEVGGLPLAVGRGGGDAVGVKPYAAHAELRVSTEPARGDLQVLRIVLTVEDNHAGHPREGLGQVDHGPPVAYDVGIDPVDRDRKIEAVALRARRGDHD